MPRASSRAPKPTSSLLVFNGRELVPNDHIYVSAPWDERDGEPYLIARIIEILQPSKPVDGASSTSSSATSTPRNGPATSQLRLRVNYYFRTRDITNRYVADHRVLVASFHSDVVPAEYVRGTCTVKFREHVDNLDRYKREPDTFYWHQLYDRYLHRYFDVVPTYKVKNAPAEIVHHLNDNFEFVLCEVGTGQELCDAQRGCCVCSKWAANPESVTCARCASVFHLNCLDPPLPAKPKAGYGWSCAPCSKAYDEQVESYAEAGLGPPPIRKASETVARVQLGNYDPKAPQMLSQKGKGKAREVDASVRSDPRDWHMTNGWPFRYFGMHASAYNILDPHESLTPRARTRLGNKFQCNVPEWDFSANQQVAPPESRTYFQPKRSRASTPLVKGEKEKQKKLKNVEAPPRGTDDAVTIIWRPNKELTDEILDDLFAQVKKIRSYSTSGVDLLNKAVQLIQTHNGDIASTIAALRKVTLQSLGHAGWSEEEKRKLVEGAEHYNNDIEEIAAMIPTKKMGDVVKRYYIHIGHNRQEDEATQPEEKVAAATRSVRQQPSASTVAASNKRRTRAVARELADEEAADEEDDEDNGSVCGQPSTAAGRRNRFCAICAETESRRWYFCPDNISELDVKPTPLVMCESCGIRWRHYGAQYPPYGDELKPLPQAKGPSKKELERIASEEARLAEEAAVEVALEPKEPTPPPPPPPKPVIPPKPCLLCKRFEPKTTLFQCDNCTLAVHASCGGLPEGIWPYDEWLCDLCERQEERNPLVLHPHCVLCPEAAPIPMEQEGEAPYPITPLDLLKPTELNNYVHLLCAVWHRELVLGEPSLVSPVEGFPFLPKRRILEKCSICKMKEVGCTVKCEDCEKHFHVSCAFSAGYKFAFEIQAVRKKRPPKDLIQVKFKEEEGAMVPCVWCPDHHFTHYERKTYDIGARDQPSKLMYVRTQKVPKFPEAPLYYRQGKRLDAIVEPVIKPKAATPPPPPPPRSGRKSLLTSIIEEMPAPPPSSSRPARLSGRATTSPRSAASPRGVTKPPQRKKRTSLARESTPPMDWTPFEQQPEQQHQFELSALDPEFIMSYQPPPEPAHEPQLEPAFDVGSRDGTPVQLEETPQPGKRVRKAPKRFEIEEIKPKPTKKRRTGSLLPADPYGSPLTPVENGGGYHYPESPINAVNSSAYSNSFNALPPLPAANDPLPSLPDIPGLPTLPSFNNTLPPLPQFPPVSAAQPGAFADAFYPTDAQLQPFLYPAFLPLPTLPNGEAGAASTLDDPAFQALTALSAAAAEAKVEAPKDAPNVEELPASDEVNLAKKMVVDEPDLPEEPINGIEAPGIEPAEPLPVAEPSALDVVAAATPAPVPTSSALTSPRRVVSPLPSEAAPLQPEPVQPEPVAPIAEVEAVIEPVADGTEEPVADGVEEPVANGVEEPVPNGVEERTVDGAEEPSVNGVEEPVTAEEPMGVEAPAAVPQAEAVEAPEDVEPTPPAPRSVAQEQSNGSLAAEAEAEQAADPANGDGANGEEHQVQPPAPTAAAEQEQPVEPSVETSPTIAAPSATPAAAAAPPPQPQASEPAAADSASAPLPHRPAHYTLPSLPALPSLGDTPLPAVPLPRLPRPNLPQPQARYPAPPTLDGLNVNPILNYVRAHEQSSHGAGGFRVDTPDDSDAASGANSPAPSSGFNSPGPHNSLPPLDMGFGPLPPLDGPLRMAAAGPSGHTGHGYGAFAATSSGEAATPAPKRRRSSVKGQASPAVCANCGTSDSSLWRRDEHQRKLCNSCGLYYKTHGHDRPANVIARGIGAARVQKRKAQSTIDPDTLVPGGSTSALSGTYGSGSGSPPSAGPSSGPYKRPKMTGVPTPLQQPPTYGGGSSMSPIDDDDLPPLPTPPQAGPSGAPPLPASAPTSSNGTADPSPYGTRRQSSHGPVAYPDGVPSVLRRAPVSENAVPPPAGLPPLPSFHPVPALQPRSAARDELPQPPQAQPQPVQAVQAQQEQQEQQAEARSEQGAAASALFALAAGEGERPPVEGAAEDADGEEEVPDAGVEETK
ncbi:hypothetical protein JCM8097_007887 [Rhodosporidiobolus ruineniae]